VLEVQGMMRRRDQVRDVNGANPSWELAFTRRQNQRHQKIVDRSAIFTRVRRYGQRDVSVQVIEKIFFITNFQWREMQMESVF
jgi:hypothetical protein